MSKNTEILQQTSRYKGMTRKKYKRKYQSSCAGKTKSSNCQTNPIKKAVIIYPRWYRVNPELYMSVCALTDKDAKSRKILSGGTL